MKMQEFFSVFRFQRFPEYPQYQMCEKVICNDGFTMSVQASEAHYCTPRQSYDGPYSAFEIGFPSQAEDLIAEYAEDTSSALTDTVYPQVPVDLIDQVIEKHGGIDLRAVIKSVVEREIAERTEKVVTKTNLSGTVRGANAEDVVKIIKALKE